MSVVNVRPSLSAADSIEYALYGVGKTKSGHLRDGTTRAAALTCSAGDPDDFVRLAHDVARAKSRRVELYSYVQAFAPDEFNVNNEDDIRRVHELGVKLAERMHSAHYVVVTHTDSAGQHLHNHIYIANHDLMTGKALTRFRSWTRGLHQLNDELMKEENCQVLPSPVKAKDDWDTRRGTFTAGGFEQVLGDKIMEVLADDTVRDRASFERALEAEGVKIAETHRDGWSYKMRRANGKLGRRKASSLCDEFTAKSIAEIFEYRNKQIQEIQEDNMKLIDKMKQESAHEEIQETAPVPQVETVQEEKQEEKQEETSALAEFTEEQKRELWRIYDREESRMHDIERNSGKEFGSMDYMARMTFGFELERLADEWRVTEIDKDAAFNAVKEVKEENVQNARAEKQKIQEKPTPTPAVREEKSEKPVARTAKRSERRSTEQKQQQPAQQPKQYKPQQKQQEQLSPEEELYEAARHGALNVIRRGESDFMAILAAWVVLVKAEHKLIQAKEKPTPEEMREIEERDEEQYRELTRGERAEALEELERRVHNDLRKQYKRGIKQIKQQRKQQKQAQQQQDDGAPTLTPEQAEMHAAYQRNLARQNSREMEL